MSQAEQSDSRSRERQSWFIDPAALMQIKNLNLRAKSVVDGFASGLHRSPLHGFSVEFAQYRPYVQGDDPRGLDWKLMARTDRCYVKQYEDETNRRCYLLLDQSRSMAYGTLGYSKADYARTMAATVAYYLNSQRDAVGVMTCGLEKSDFLPPRHRTGQLQQVMRLLEQASEGLQSELGGAIEKLAGLSKRRGLVLVFTDCLVDPDTLFQPLGYLRGRGHQILFVRLLDPTEVDFRMEKSAMVRDMETGQEMYVDPQQAEKEYRERFEAHEAQLIEICHRRGARLLTMTTDQPLERVLLELISSQTTLTAAGSLTTRKSSPAADRPVALGRGR